MGVFASPARCLGSQGRRAEGQRVPTSVLALPCPPVSSCLSQTTSPPRPPKGLLLWLGCCPLPCPVTLLFPRSTGELDVSSCSQSKKDQLYRTAREAFAGQACTRAYYDQIRPYLGRCWVLQPAPCSSWQRGTGMHGFRPPHAFFKVELQ